VDVGYVFVGPLIILGIVFALMAVYTTLLCMRLKKHHHELWLSLGSPMPGLANRSKDQTKILRFLRLRQYASLKDEETKRLAAGTRFAGRVFLAYIFAGSALVFGIVLIGKYWKTL
jgi:hypothetical protein